MIRLVLCVVVSIFRLCWYVNVGWICLKIWGMVLILCVRIFGLDLKILVSWVGLLLKLGISSLMLVDGLSFLMVCMVVVYS